MPPQEEIDGRIKLGVIFPQVNFVKLLVNIIKGVYDSPEKVHFVKQAILERSEIPKGVIAGVVDIGIARHIGAEIIKV